MAETPASPAPKIQQAQFKPAQQIATPDQLEQNINKVMAQQDCPSCDLSGTDLSGMDLRKLNFSMSQFNDSNLSGTDLRRANLTDCQLAYADLSYAKLRGAKVNNCNFYQADLEGADVTAEQLRQMGGVFIKIEPTMDIASRGIRG